MNANGDPNAEYLSDGITESLINSLSTLPHLRVMSRDSAFMFKGKDTDAEAVGQKLGVRAVLKGRVDSNRLTVLKASPLFDPLRSDPRFADLLRP